MRMVQLSLQAEGILAILRPEVADKLNLSFGQLERATDIVEKMREREAALREEAERRDFAVQAGTGERKRRMRRLEAEGVPLDKRTAETVKNTNKAEFESLRGLHTLAAKLSKENREAAERKLFALLKPAQRAAFQRMQGKPFDVAKLHYPESQKYKAPASDKKSANSPASKGS